MYGEITFLSQISIKYVRLHTLLFNHDRFLWSKVSLKCNTLWSYQILIKAKASDDVDNIFGEKIMWHWFEPESNRPWLFPVSRGVSTPDVPGPQAAKKLARTRTTERIVFAPLPADDQRVV